MFLLFLLLIVEHEKRKKKFRLKKILVFFLLTLKNLIRDITALFGTAEMAFHAADTHRATYKGAARKGRLKERCGLEPRTNFLFV